MKRILLPILSAGLLMGQSEQALKAFFEGKTVRVKMDMPATHEGVDVYIGKAPPVDFKSYSARVKKYDVSLRQGDSVMITTIRLKGKNLEFQLGGGGYGTFGDDTGYVSLPPVPKSNREKDLERDIKNETDSRRLEYLRKELARLVERRQRDERLRREEEARLRENKKREIFEKSLRAGSRFNIWYPANYLKEAVPTPQDVMSSLSEYIDFGALSGPPRN